MLDATMLVAGSMIGSGIFIGSAAIARQAGSPGWLLAVWLITGVLTVIAATQLRRASSDEAESQRAPSLQPATRSNVASSPIKEALDLVLLLAAEASSA